MGRTELLRVRGVDYRDLEDEGVLFVMAKCSARYLAAARYDDILTLSTRITRTGRARIDHAYELKRKSDGLLVATAETTLACVDVNGGIIAIPDSVLGKN
jgi:acyl-CoA thioester hydrolase